MTPRFVRFCDSFGIPILTLVDVPRSIAWSASSAAHTAPTNASPAPMGSRRGPSRAACVAVEPSALAATAPAAPRVQMACVAAYSAHSVSATETASPVCPSTAAASRAAIAMMSAWANIAA